MENCENFLFQLLKLGKAEFENDQFIIFNATNIIFPTRSFLYLMNKLSEVCGLEESKKILKDVGSFQIKQALVRYEKLFEIENMEKIKFLEFSRKIGGLLGLGKFEIKDKIALCRNNPIAIEYELMFGKSVQPIDFYLCGIWEEVYCSLLGKPAEVKETKCIACGDPYCQFEVFPAEESKEESKK